MHLSCRLGHKQTSTPEGFQIGVITHNCGILPESSANPPYIPPPFICIIHHPPCLPNIQTSFKQSFMESIHLFRGQPTKQLPTYNPTFTVLTNLSFPILSVRANHQNHFRQSSYSPLLPPHSTLLSGHLVLSPFSTEVFHPLL